MNGVFSERQGWLPVREWCGLHLLRWCPFSASRVGRGCPARCRTPPPQVLSPLRVTSCRWSSFVSFTVGSLLPLTVILLVPASYRVSLTAAAVLATLWFTGTASARLGGAPVKRAVLRNVLGGALAMAATYAVGTALGSAGV